MRIKIFILTLLIVLLANPACNRTDTPVIPADFPDIITPTLNNPSGNHFILGIYKLDLDPDSEIATAVPVRNSNFHFDVTQFFLNPYCPDCLVITVTELDVPAGILDLDVALKNSTPVSAWDIRLILRWETEHIWLTDHDDDYTALFDDGGFKTINPFIAYAKDQTDRFFESLTTHTRPVHFRFDEMGHWGEFTLVIEASYPENCAEPYEIANKLTGGELIGVNPVIIQCDVFDWQNNVDEVTIDPSPLADTEIIFVNQSGTTWIGLLANENGMPPGEYRLLIRAISTGDLLTDSIYDYINVTVGISGGVGLDPGPWPMIGRDPAHSSLSPFQPPVTEPELQWSTMDHGILWTVGYSGTVVSSAGQIYVARVSGLYCLDLDGNQQWHIPCPILNPRQPPMPLVSANGSVVVCWSSLFSNSDPQGIYAYNANTGEELWSTTHIKYSPFGDEKHISVYDPVVLSEDGLLVAVAREHVIIGLDIEDGSQKWLWPNNENDYESILAGSYTDAWRGAPAIAPDGRIIAVADWFDNPRLIILSDFGINLADKELQTITMVNCHPAVTSDNKVIVAGFISDIVTLHAVVEAWTTYGVPIWSYTDDVIEILQGTIGITQDDDLYFMDGRGVHDIVFPNDYHVYLLSLSDTGIFNWRTKILSRTSASSPALSHFRDGIAVGSDGTAYVSGSWNHKILANTNISGVSAVNVDGDLLWTYNQLVDWSKIDSYYGPPAIGSDGTIYVNRSNRLEALK